MLLKKKFVYVLCMCVGTASKAIEVLIDAGVKEEKIIFLNLIAAPEGIKFLKEKYPKVMIVTTEIDDTLNDKKFIVPGHFLFIRSEWNNISQSIFFWE
jgi:uracil phosphoribosyltransferase